MISDFLDEDTQPGYPLIPPADDHRWQPHSVVVLEGEAVQLCSFPREHKNFPVTSIHSDDLIAILPQTQFGEWVAARAEHRIGWLDLRAVKLTPVKRPMPLIEDEADDTREMRTAGMILSRMRTKGLRPPEDSIYLSEREIERIERYMRGISLTLKLARKRSNFRQE